MQFRKATIVGVGLLGGSLGLAIKRRRLAGQVTGLVRRASSAAECRRLGVVDAATRDVREAVSGADLIVLCTPLSQMRPLVERMLPALGRGAILTDVGSVKGTIVSQLENLARKAGARFVGSHPLAGSEKTGVKAARSDLFVSAACVVTPSPRTDPAALKTVERFWASLGGRVLHLSPSAHDALVSRSSHLPHFAAVVLANLVLDPTNPRELRTLCASGFRDTTRIASGSPEMWRDIALANRGNLRKAIDAFARELQRFSQSLEKADAEAIARYLRRAKSRRDDWFEQSQMSSSES